MASLTLIASAISLIYVIPSYILHFMVLHVMITRRKQFRSHFYLFYIIQGIIEVIEYPLEYIGRRSISTPEFYDFYSAILPNSGVCLTIFNWSYIYLSALRDFIPFYLALYRLSAVALPTKCKKIWTRIFPHCIIAVVLLGLLATFTMFFGSTLERSQNPSGQKVLTLLNNHSAVPWYRVSTGLVILIVTATVTSFFSYITTIYLLKCKQRGVGRKFINVNQEYRLNIFMMLVWGTQVYTCITQGLFFFRDLKNVNQQIFLSELNFFGIELSIFLNPWFMLFCNKTLRLELIQMYFPWSKLAARTTVIAPQYQKSSSNVTNLIRSSEV